MPCTMIPLNSIKYFQKYRFGIIRVSTIKQYSFTYIDIVSACHQLGGTQTVDNTHVCLSYWLNTILLHIYSIMI